MNDELIKRETLIRRINEWTDEILPDDLLELLQDCRAALTEMPRAVAYVDNSSLEELKRELCSGIMVGSFSERHNRTKPLYEAPHDTAALSRKYVPMTDDELLDIFIEGELSIAGSLLEVQSEIIRRAGLEVDNGN